MSSVAERTVSLGAGAEYVDRSVRTRISWGAIAAGVAVALAIYTLLMSLGIAIGMSVPEDVDARSFGSGAGIWGFIALLIALFAGGWVTTQVTVGESQTEAVLYGVVLWATTSVLLLWLAANGVRAGMETASAMHQMSSNSQFDSTSANQRTAEVNQRTPEERRSDMQRAREVGREGSWWAFAGILLSMVAAIGGALVGPIELTIRRDSRYPRDERNLQPDRRDL